MKSTKQVHDFKTLDLKIDEDSSSPHAIYFKEHSVREHTKDKPSGRTLFVLNVPPYADEKGLAHAFSEAGNVESVIFSVKPGTMEESKTNKFLTEPIKPSFKVAYINFQKVSELDKALKLKELRPLRYKNHDIQVGINKWIYEYNSTVFTPKYLKEKVEKFMKEHDKETAKSEKKEKEFEQEDDEGWVTVTKKGKVQSFARSEKVENKILSKEEKKSKKKELKNFYTFQIRESKMKHIVALRQKFEEDKKKIAQIKQSRRFKPF